MAMKTSIVFLALSLVAFSSGCSRNEPPHESSPVQPSASGSPEVHDAIHDEHAAHVATPTLAPGQLWTTDEPLRTAMLRIRAAVERVAGAYEQKQLTPPDAQALAVTVEENVTYMITNCKLAPKPDAALHALIGRLLNAAVSVKKDPASDAGVPQLRAVLHDYQSTFDHPGWSPLDAH